MAELPTFGTLGEAVEWAEAAMREADLYFGHGLPEAFDEAVYLTLAVMGLPLDDVDSVWDRPLSPQESRALALTFRRRIDERTPAAYLTNEAWLGPYRFYVDERVIVPRSFIAELLLEGLAPWVEPDAVTRVLDLCTGSGCLAILAALAYPDAKVDAVDLSRDAIAVARRNIEDYELANRIRLLRGDMWDKVRGQRYDLIVTNPPYVTGESMRALPAEYHREPAMALASGEDGLDHVRVILDRAVEHLLPGGVLVVEAGFNREGVEAAFPRLPLTWLEVSAGDDIVFMITREELRDARG